MLNIKRYFDLLTKSWLSIKLRNSCSIRACLYLLETIWNSRMANSQKSDIQHSTFPKDTTIWQPLLILGQGARSCLPGISSFPWVSLCTGGWRFLSLWAPLTGAPPAPCCPGAPPSPPPGCGARTWPVCTSLYPSYLCVDMSNHWKGKN